MSIVKMKRLRLVALNSERDDLLARLLHVGCVEVTEAEGNLADPDWAALLQKDSSSLPEVKSRLNSLSSALDALRKYAPAKSGLFIKRYDITESDFFNEDAKNDALMHANAINDCTHKISQTYSQENRINAQRAGLVPWRGLDLPLEQESTDNARLILCTCPAAVDVGIVKGELAAATELAEVFLISEDKEQKYFLLVVHKSEADAAIEAIRSRAFGIVHFSGVVGTAAENIAKLDQRLAELAQQREALIEQLVSHKDSRPALQLCLDRMTQELSQQSAREHFLTDGTILFLEGWVATTGLSDLEEELKKFCVAYDLSDPTEEDTVPTLLKNPKWMRCINMVTEMYSLPEYHHGIDPNPLIFGFYIIFFGFMFADLAYGIIIFLISFIISKKFKPKGTMGYMFGLGQYLGITTAIFGALTGGFFGDAIYQFTTAFTSTSVSMPALINPLADPMTILIIAIIMGCIHMLFGQCIHIYMECRDGHPLEGLLDVVPWWILFAGIGLFALQGVTWGIIAGFAALLLTQGRHKKGIFGKLFGGIASWYDITSWLGDILSYARLMALMLATSVIAQVMNILGTLPGMVVVFFVIFVIGHVFNIGINLIGTYVHAARLQYLEFFSKFYKEGGIPFAPLAYNTKYVDIVEDKK